MATGETLVTDEEVTRLAKGMVKALLPEGWALVDSETIDAIETVLRVSDPALVMDRYTAQDAKAQVREWLARVARSAQEG